MYIIYYICSALRARIFYVIFTSPPREQKRACVHAFARTRELNLILILIDLLLIAEKEEKDVAHGSLAITQWASFCRHLLLEVLDWK